MWTTPIWTCGWASSGLSVSEVSGASPISAATASATRGRSRASATRHQRDAPEDEQQRVEQVQQEVRRPVHAGSAEEREVVQRHRVLQLGRRHQLGDDPDQRQRDHAQAGQAEGARGSGAWGAPGDRPRGHRPGGVRVSRHVLTRV